MHPECKSTSHRSTRHRSTIHRSTSHRSASHQSIRHWSTRHRAVFHRSQALGRQWPVTSHQSSSHWSFCDYQALGTGQLITRHQSPVIQSSVTGQQSIHQAPVITHQTTDNDYLVASKTHRSSEQSLPNEPQNSSTSKRVLLPLEPEFSQISDPSIVIAPPSNTWVSDNRHTSPRHSRGDLPKDKHKTKKRRRHRVSISSSSSRSSSTSHKRSKRSKTLKHSHKRRRRRLMSSSSSSSNHFIHDYGYKRTRVSLQVAEVQSTLQPVRIMDQTPIIHSDNVVNKHVTQVDKATKPLSGIECLMENRVSPLMTLPQSKLVENTTKFIQSKLDAETLTKDWLCPQLLVLSLAATKYYKS